MREITAIVLGALIGIFATLSFRKPIIVVSSGLNKCYAKVDELQTRINLRDSVIEYYAFRDGKRIVEGK